MQDVCNSFAIMVGYTCNKEKSKNRNRKIVCLRVREDRKTWMWPNLESGPILVPIWLGLRVNLAQPKIWRKTVWKPLIGHEVTVLDHFSRSTPHPKNLVTVTCVLILSKCDETWKATRRQGAVALRSAVHKKKSRGNSTDRPAAMRSIRSLSRWLLIGTTAYWECVTWNWKKQKCVDRNTVEMGWYLSTIVEGAAMSSQVKASSLQTLQWQMHRELFSAWFTEN